MFILIFYAIILLKTGKNEGINMKQLIIDRRMRKLEKEKLKEIG